MTWEETIKYIRSKEEFADLVRLAYLDADLELNVARFRLSEEYTETLQIFQKKLLNRNSKILEIGAGNGVSTISFALSGFDITAVEPDKSNTVGAGAIQYLKNIKKLNNVEIIQSYGEELPFARNTFDAIYIRQAMHHANNLNTFIKEAARVLKPNGVFLTVRDHVIYNEIDKQWFLQSHPLQQYYGGENAFTVDQYCKAFRSADLKIIKIYKHFDNPINYFPLSSKDILEKRTIRKNEIKESLKRRIGFFSTIPLFQQLYKLRYEKYAGKLFDESKVAGRMYSFLAKKK